MKDKNQINNYLHTRVYHLLNTLPSNIKEQIKDVTFAFDMDSIRVQNNQVCFAITEKFNNISFITFYIDLISLTGTTKQGLDNLVVHEFSHALGMNEKDAEKLTKNRLSKDL